MTSTEVNGRLARYWLPIQVLFLLLAITVASVQCFARCATAPCHATQTVPPCHRHAPERQSTPIESCQYLFLAGDRTSLALSAYDLSSSLDAALYPLSETTRFYNSFGIAVSRAALFKVPLRPLLSVLRI